MQTSSANRFRQEKDHAFYGAVKDGQPTPPNLIIRTQEGTQIALSYSFLTKEMQYDPSEGISLAFQDADGQRTVVIRGRNLLSLWDALVWHKVTFIRELEPSSPLAESDLAITQIELKSSEF